MITHDAAKLALRTLCLKLDLKESRRIALLEAYIAQQEGKDV